MQMNSDEIVVRYRQAKDQRAQIKILAELNNCSKGDIEEILKVAGCELPSKGGRPKKMVETPESHAAPIETPESSAKTLAQVDLAEIDRTRQRLAAEKLTLEDVLDIFVGALTDWREVPDEIDRETAAKTTLAYMAGVADAYQAIHGPIRR